MKLKRISIIALMITTILLLFSTFIQAKTVIVDTDTLILRSEASTDSETVALLDNGDKLEYVGEEGQWYKVSIDGKTGFVSKEYSKIEEDSNTQNGEQPKKEEPVPNPTEKVEQSKPEEKANPTPKIEEKPVEVLPTEMKVSKDSNIYILPLINANTIQEVKQNTNVKILSKTNGWYYVETDSVMGWIRKESLEDPSVVSDDIQVNNDNTQQPKPDATNVESINKTMYVNTESVYVRKGPGTEFEDIDSLILNDSVKVIAEEGEWYKVDISGNIGYIAKSLLSENEVNTTTRSNTSRSFEQTANNNVSNSSLGNQIVEFAKSYLGVPYVYGASGPDSFDCSGFVMYVFDNFGITLSHSAIAQSGVGDYVEKDNLQPGDLVFFTDYETGYGIGHVGIYIGDGNFIHASSGTGYCVKTSTLLSGSYYNRYETARRVI